MSLTSQLIENKISVETFIQESAADISKFVSLIAAVPGASGVEQYLITAAGALLSLHGVPQSIVDIIAESISVLLKLPNETPVSNSVA